MEIGLLTMRKGELARFLFKPCYAFGAVGCPPLIPPNATVLFEVELLDFLDSAESDRFFDLTPVSGPQAVWLGGRQVLLLIKEDQGGSQALSVAAWLSLFPLEKGWAACRRSVDNMLHSGHVHMWSMMLSSLSPSPSLSSSGCSQEQQERFPLQVKLKVADTEREFGNYLFRQKHFIDAKARYKRVNGRRKQVLIASMGSRPSPCLPALHTHPTSQLFDPCALVHALSFPWYYAPILRCSMCAQVTGLFFFATRI